MLALHDSRTYFIVPAMLTGVHNGIALQPVPTRGRGFIAQRDITAGETVLIDWPIVLVSSNSEQYCYNCLRDLSIPGKAVSNWLTGLSSHL